MYNRRLEYEFDPKKEACNLVKHGIDFETASEVFLDGDGIVAPDFKHSHAEPRWYAIGKIRDGRIITVWFAMREERIRIIGAAPLRKGKKEYERRKISGLPETKMD